MLRWDAVEPPDGLPVTYRGDRSTDGGATWEPLFEGLTVTEYPL
ncbi:hypothetical protein BH24GEM3_BH24GEM3_02060 [soil metagenome]